MKQWHPGPHRPNLVSPTAWVGQQLLHVTQEARVLITASDLEWCQQHYLCLPVELVSVAGKPARGLSVARGPELRSDLLGYP